MKVSGKIRSMVQHILTEGQRARQLKQYGRYQQLYDNDFSLTDAALNQADRNSLYCYMHHYFHHNCPKLIHQHRIYYSQEQRGFGEDAFHAMWYLLLRQFKPVRCLEIGIYRGQVITLWALISRLIGFPIEVHGISPFTSVGDAVSRYGAGIDYHADVLDSFDHFGLPRPRLLKALSTDAEGVDYIKSQQWDLIYVDGGHDFETALGDYQLCRKQLAPGGILVLDDASLGTDYTPPLFAFAGHPGPSRVARDYADREMGLMCAVGHNNIYRKL